MCLTNLTTKQPKTAKEDIICYKLLIETFEGLLRAYFREFFYTIGKLYTLPHFTYSTNPFWEAPQVGQGFHSYSIPDYPINRSKRYKSFIAVKCIIPKGTKYWKGDQEGGHTCYASRAIIIKEILTT